MLSVGKKREQTDQLTYRVFVTPNVTTLFDLKQPRMVINLNATNILYYLIATTSTKFSILSSKNTIFSLDTSPDFIKFLILNTFLLNFVLKNLREFSG